MDKIRERVASHIAREVSFGRACKEAIIEVRTHVLAPDDATTHYWLSPCCADPGEIPGAVKARMAELAAVRAERDKLRAALVEIRDMPFSVRFSQMFERAQTIARAALDEGGA